MKKGFRKKQDDQIDEHGTPTEPLPDLSVMFFPPSDQSRPMPGGRTIQPPFVPYPDLQQPLPIYPYLPKNTKNRLTGWRRFFPACVGLFCLCVQILLIVRFGIRFLNLSPDVIWVDVVTSVSAIFVLPFQVCWSQIPLVGSLVPTNVELYTLVAILMYGVLSRLLVGILKVLLKSR